jgi:ATP synthase protein I
MESKKVPIDFSKQIADKERRKIRAQKEGSTALQGLGLFGLVGWTVVVPTLIGTVLGIWLDKRYQQSFSWTLSLLVVGVLVGCFAAWDRISKEDKKMNFKDELDD